MNQWSKLSINYAYQRSYLDDLFQVYPTIPEGIRDIDEEKFLTDMGGHQNTQFEDAIATVEEKNVNAIQIAILDGILFIPGKSKMYKYISNPYSNHNIMSSLVLREFLYHL